MGGSRRKPGIDGGEFPRLPLPKVIKGGTRSTSRRWRGAEKMAGFPRLPERRREYTQSPPRGALELGITWLFLERGIPLVPVSVGKVLLLRRLLFSPYGGFNRRSNTKSIRTPVPTVDSFYISQMNLIVSYDLPSDVLLGSDWILLSSATWHSTYFPTSQRRASTPL